MKKFNAFGAIDLLLGLVIVSVLVAMMMPLLRGENPNKPGSQVKTQEAEAYKMIEEIQQKRQQANDAQNYQD